MAAPRLVVELTIEEEDVTKLMAIARSRTEPASRVERARMLLAYRDGRKDADLTRKGFRDCGGGLDNYDSCTAGVQIDDVRAAGMDEHIYSNQAACGF